MPRRNDSWGIEVGANAVKAVRLIRSKTEVRLEDYIVMPFKKVLTTPEINVEEEIKVKLEELKALKDFRKTTNVLSVPGHMAFARFAKLPPVEPKQVKNIVRFEAQQQIPFPMDQVEWDYHVFMRPDSPDVEVGIFAITKERINQYMKVFRDLKIPIHGVTLSPLALYNAIYYDQQMTPDSPGQIIMDIGSTSTDLIICEGGKIWFRPLPIGGNQFTEALVRSFKLSFSKAEKLKAEAPTSKYARQIFQAMRPVFADLVQEMQRSLGYYQSLNRDAKLEQLVGFGSTFRLPGLQKFLKQQLQMEVIRPDGFLRIKPEDKHASQFVEDALNLGTAYGLALQGVSLETVDASILPVRMTKQRLWRAKQLWFCGAAAAMVGAVGISAATFYTQQKIYNVHAQDNDSKIEGAVRLASGFKTRWTEVEGGVDPRAQIENLRRILDYRDIWPKMMQDLNLAILSLQPQQALLSPVYTPIGQIPRDQRRQMIIESITTDYKFTGEVEAGGAAKPSPGTMKVEEIWGERVVTDPANSTATPPAAPDPTKRIRPPSFFVTIKGTTPYSDGAKFLDNTIMQWLRDNLDRPNRPYRLVINKDTSLDVTASTSSMIPTGPSAPGSRTSPRGGGPRPPGPGGGPLPPSIATPSAPGAGLYPTRPLKEESTARDWKFELHFIIELIRPEDARQAEDSTRNEPTSRLPEHRHDDVMPIIAQPMRTEEHS